MALLSVICLVFRDVFLLWACEWCLTWSVMYITTSCGRVCGTAEALQADYPHSAFSNRAKENLQELLRSHLKTIYFSVVLHYYKIMMRQEGIPCFHGIIWGRQVLLLTLYSSRRFWSLETVKLIGFSYWHLFSDCFTANIHLERWTIAIRVFLRVIFNWEHF